MDLFPLELLLFLGLPLFLSVGSGWLCWGALSRPLVFMAACTIALYVVYVASMYFLAPSSVGYSITAVQPGDPPHENPTFLLLEPYKVPLLTFVVIAIPVLLGMLRLFKKGAGGANEG